MSDEDNTSNDVEANNPNAVDAFETLRRFLTEDGWNPEQLEGKNIFRVNFLGKNGEMRCFAQIRMDISQFLFYAILPVRVSEEKRHDIAEFITRANYGMRIGNFEMDFSDGEIRYKSTLDFEDETLTEAWIKHAIYPAVSTMDRYLPGIMGVMYGSKTPLGAIEEIES